MDVSIWPLTVHMSMLLIWVSICSPYFGIWSDVALGPKLYIVFGNNEGRDIGTTCLHIDITDAHNLMVWATNPHEAGAVWHIFSAESRATLQDYLCSLPKCKGKVDPILAQTSYLMQSCAVLLKASYSPFAHGENIQNAIKIASDFISVHNID